MNGDGLQQEFSCPFKRFTPFNYDDDDDPICCMAYYENFKNQKEMDASLHHFSSSFFLFAPLSFPFCAVYSLAYGKLN